MSVLDFECLSCNTVLTPPWSANGGFTDQVILEASPTCASFDLRKMAEESVGRECRTLCLHAKKISIRHPISGQEMTFEAPPSF